MARRIEDYALIGDTETAALVGLDGSVDWMCVPSFDSGACFAALLGDRRHGRWQLAPIDADPKRTSSSRRYHPGTLVLETTFRTSSGSVRIVDCMPPRDRTPDVVRLCEGVQGEVAMRMELSCRSCTGSRVAGDCPRRCSSGCRVTRARFRCGPATPR